MADIQYGIPLRLYTTLRAGGKAEQFCVVDAIQELAHAVAKAHKNDTPLTILGSGSNMLPSDDGVPGLVVLNRARRIAVAKTGEVLADTGCAFQEPRTVPEDRPSGSARAGVCRRYPRHPWGSPGKQCGRLSFERQ
jgi:UDP-N-acetylenolpyruvoylglucosamine reductase